MYVPDTLRRISNEEVARYYATTGNQAEKLRNDESWAAAATGPECGEFFEEHDVLMCDDCGDKPATVSIPVYNPADGVRGVEGAYYVHNLCEECEAAGGYLEETFYCDGCGELFITHHSWDVLYTTLDGEMLCQACAADRIEGTSLQWLLDSLKQGTTADWHRINALPGKELLWEGEFSVYSDFPGHTSLKTVADEIAAAAEEAGLSEDSTVYPCITHGYQFSCVLGVYYDA